MLSNQFEIKSDGTKKKVSPKKKFEIKSHGTKFVREVKIVLANKKKEKKERGENCCFYCLMVVNYS